MIYLNKKGFTLVELLIVIAIIGIIAAIAIPNMIVALQKGKQKVTMSDMKSIGTAIESYCTDVYVAPNTTANQLASVLQPFYIRGMPLKDGWGHSWYYSFNYDLYSVGSSGNDVNFSWNSVGQYVVSNIAHFRNDIIFSNGQFSYHPKVR